MDLSGLGGALGAAAGGYLTGQNRGEAEAYRRSQIEEANRLKLLLAQRQLKPEKEELPYEVKSFLDTRSRIYGPSGDYRERLDWEGSGNEKVHSLLVQSLRYGPQAARLAYAIATQPEGTDTTDLQQQLGRITGGGQGQAPMNLGGAPKPAESVDQFLGQQGQQGPQQPPSFAEGVKPSLARGYQYGPTDLERAREGLVGAQRGRIQALTPEEVRNLQARTGDIGFQQDLGKRKFNLDAAQNDFNNALKAAQQRIDAGQTDYRLMQQTWSDVLNAAARLHLNGGNPSDALKPLLFNRLPFGQTAPNAEAISRYLGAMGLPAGDIQAIIQGAGGGAGSFGGAPGGGVQQPGGAPPLPQVGGLGPATGGGGVSMDAGQAMAQALGFRVTSTNTGKHNEGSAHYENRAFDLSVQGKNPNEVKQMMQAYAQAGYRVLDERRRPAGQKVWGGPHVHVELPEGVAGTPAQQPGMVARTTPGQVPAGNGNAQRVVDEAMTPQGAPQSPFAENTLEGRLWAQYAKGVDILAAAKGTPFEEAAAAVVDQANARQRQRRFAGTPAPDRLGARSPEETDFAGTLGYKEVGIPEVETSPIEPSAGFGSRQPAARQVIEIPGVATGAPQAAPPAAAPPQETVQAPPAGNPSLVGYDGGGLTLPAFKLPNLGLGSAGPGVFSMAPGERTGKGAERIPPENRGTKAVAAAERNGKGPRVGVKGLDKQSAAFQDKVAGSSEGGNKGKNVTAEVARYKKHPLGPGIAKWLSKHKIGKPETQRAVYADVIGKLAPKLLDQGRSEAWIRKNMVMVLDQYLKPGS